VKSTVAFLFSVAHGLFAFGYGGLVGAPGNGRTFVRMKMWGRPEQAVADQTQIYDIEH
jgi:hypothetical protein